MAEIITFALAFSAYALVALAVGLQGWRLPARAVTAAAAAVALAHVGLVWSLRFEWSLVYAFEKSPPAFVIFHTALAMICASALAPQAASRQLLFLAFPVVTAGSVGAAFRYDVVAMYRIPVLATFTLAILAVTAAGFRAWRPRAASRPTAPPARR